MSRAPDSDRLPQSVALGVLVAAALLLIAGGIAIHAAGLDAAWLLRVHAQAPGRAAVTVWSCITVLGLGWTPLILVPATDRSRGEITALLLPTFVLGTLFTHLPKWLLASPRPAATPLLAQLHVIGDAFRGPVSMPSGHALTAAALAALLWLAFPRRRALAAGLGLALFAGVVGWSRVVVGAHWPADVFCGAGLGLVAVAVPLAAGRAAWIGRLQQRFVAAIRSRTGQRWVALIEIAAGAGLLHEHTGYPAGNAMVVLLASVATVSAALRWDATSQRRALRREPGDAPGEPT